MRVENLRVNRLLQRRFFLVEKASDARIIGILVGTLAVGTPFTARPHRLSGSGLFGDD